MRKATFALESGQEIVIELFEKDAPKTVENFENLIKSGFYDGMQFHRVVPGFVAQTGCPKGNGYGGPGYAIKCEINLRLHKKGTVAMAHAGKDTGGSQFFICYNDLPQLDGQHTVFGRVAEGMDAAEALQRGEKIKYASVGETA